MRAGTDSQGRNHGEAESIDFARDVAVAGDYAYLANGDAGLRVMDISDAANPVEIGLYNLPTEAQTVVVTEDRLVQSYIYLANQEAGLTILQFGYRLFLPVVLGSGQ